MSNYVEQPEVEEASDRYRMPAKFKRFLIKVQGGKVYLPAQYRVVWFRDECPINDGWGISTSLIEGGLAEGIATVSAAITDPTGRIVASGMKTETKAGFAAGWVEKAETGAIARALALCGFGTQFSADLDDDGTRVADSPVGLSQGQNQPQGDLDAPTATHHNQPASSGQQQPQNTQPVATAASAIWEGPGQCVRCHAPQGKRHGKPCV